jgi:hypothetical protein
MSTVHQSNSREPWELGCKLFYAAHWFALTAPDLTRLLAQAETGLKELLTLVEALQEVNDEDCNAPIENWCATPNPALSDRTPAQCVREGDGAAVLSVVKAAGKLA